MRTQGLCTELGGREVVACVQLTGVAFIRGVTRRCVPGDGYSGSVADSKGQRIMVQLGLRAAGKVRRGTGYSTTQIRRVSLVVIASN